MDAIPEFEYVNDPGDIESLDDNQRAAMARGDIDDVDSCASVTDVPLPESLPAPADHRLQLFLFSG